MSSENTEELGIGRFKLAKDPDGNLISVPSVYPLTGFVVQGEDHIDYARIHILTSDDTKDRDYFGALWTRVREHRLTSLFPEILDNGMDDEIPYYVSKFPHGEPLLDYMDNSKPWSGQMTARVLCRFIGSLHFQDEISLNDYAISYDSIWLERTIYGPRLILGDIVLRRSYTAAQDNAALILSIFKDLTKEEANDPAISEMFQSFANVPMALSTVEKRLKAFSIAGDSRNINWSEDNEPQPFLDRHLYKIKQSETHNVVEKKVKKKRDSRPFVELLGLGKLKQPTSEYRSALELDPHAPVSWIPPRPAVLLASYTVAIIMITCGLMSTPGKALRERIANHFSYEPELLVLPNSEKIPDTEPVGAYTKPWVDRYNIMGNSPISMLLNTTNSDTGMINNATVIQDEVINTFSEAIQLSGM